MAADGHLEESITLTRLDRPSQTESAIKLINKAYLQAFGYESPNTHYMSNSVRPSRYLSASPASLNFSHETFTVKRTSPSREPETALSDHPL